MAPNLKPIANNFREIANKPEVAGITMEFGFGAHQILAVDTKLSRFASTIYNAVTFTTQDLKFGDYKKVYDKLLKDPSLLCNKTEACLRRVKDGGDSAYIAVNISHFSYYYFY